jgi:hypothetical protein
MSAPTMLTLLDDGRPFRVPAVPTAEGGVRLAPADVETALGWTLKPQGLCRDERCIPVPPDVPLADADAGGVDLGRLAALLGRPLALDLAEGAAWLGVAAADRAAALASLEAPDFTLPDLDGRPHALSSYRGRKVLLLAYASW